MRIKRFVHALTFTLVSSLAAAPCALAQDAGGDALTGQVSSHVLVAGDTLVSLGARYGIEVRTLASDNDMSTTTALRVGRTLRVDNRHIVPRGYPDATVVINIPQRMLFYRNGVVAGLPVALGRPSWPTPMGSFRIATREQDPTWDVPASILAEARRAGRTQPARVPPGPANPLGAYWLGLDSGGIGIHGTNVPASIYQFASHGCIRLHPDDIAWLFARVDVGAKVALVYEPVLMTRSGGRVFLEVQRDVYKSQPSSLARVRELAAAQGLTGSVDWEAVARVLHAQHGIARDVTLEAPADDGSH